MDHSGEAERVGLSLRDTKLVVFGNPVAGTPVMEASPLTALDLHLKVLVWADDAGAVWMSYLSAEWLARRDGIPAEVSKALSAPDALTSGSGLVSEPDLGDDEPKPRGPVPGPMAAESKDNG